MDKTIAITGANGMVGAHLCCEALLQGLGVKALVRKDIDSDAFFKRLMAHKSVDESKLEILICDYEDRQSLSDILQGCDELYHCAAKVSFDGKISEMIAANVSICKRLVNICLECGIKNVTYLSSIAAIGSKNKGKYTWGNLHWNSLYGYTKYLGELEFLRGHEEGLNSRIYRAGIVLGESPNKHPFTSMLQRKIFGKMPYTNGGSGFISARLLCQKMLAAHNQNPYEASLMVSQNASYKQMAEKIAGKKSIIELKRWHLHLVQVLGFIAKNLGFSKQRLRSHSIKSMMSQSDYSTLIESDDIDVALKESINFLGKGKL